MQRNSYCSLKAPSFVSPVSSPLTDVFNEKSASGPNLAARMASRSRGPESNELRLWS